MLDEPIKMLKVEQVTNALKATMDREGHLID